MMDKKIFKDKKYIDAADQELSKQIKVLSEDALQFKGDLNRVDIKTITESGIYRCIVCTNIPFSFGILTVKNTLGYIEYLATDIQTNKTYAMTRQDNGTFSDWNCPDDKITALSKLSAQNARGTGTKPSDYINTFKVTGLKTGAECGLNGKETLASVLGINSWYDLTAGVTELMFGRTGNIYTRTHKENGEDEWTDAKQLATTDKIDISPYLKNQWANVGANILKANKVGDTVTVNGLISGGVKDVGTILFNLPSDFRPRTPLMLICVGSTPTTSKSLTCIVGVNGDVTIDYSVSTSWADVTYVTFASSFII